MLILPAVAWVLAWLGAWSVDATAAPPAWERAFARMAVNASVARRAPRISSPIPATPEELLAGMNSGSSFGSCSMACDIPAWVPGAT